MCRVQDLWGIALPNFSCLEHVKIVVHEVLGHSTTRFIVSLAFIDSG